MTNPTHHSEDDWALPAQTPTSPPSPSPSSPPSHDWSLPPQAPAAPPQLPPQQHRAPAASSPDTLRTIAARLTNPWVVVGVSGGLVFFYIISFLMTWVRYPNDEAVVNGFGWLTINLQGGDPGLMQVYMFVAFATIIILGKGAYMVGFTDKRSAGIKEIIWAGGFGTVYALFAMMTKLFIGSFITFENPYSAAILGLTNPFDNLTPVAGGGPALCLFFGLLNLVFGAALFIAFPETRRILADRGIATGLIAMLDQPAGYTQPGSPAPGPGVSQPVAASPDPLTVQPLAPEVSNRAIAEFWTWWPNVAEHFASSVAGGNSSLPELDARLAAIHPELTWTVGPGARGSAHTLIVSPGIFPALRATARRWLNGAPAPDATWYFSDRRPAASEEPVTVNGVTYDPADVVIGEPDGMTSVEVDVWHPFWNRSGFASIRAAATVAPDPQVAALLVNRAVGDTVAFSWLAPNPASREPSTQAPLAALPKVIEALEETLAEPVASGNRVQVDGTDPAGIPTELSIRLPMSSELAPTCDMHVLLTYEVAQSMYDREVDFDTFESADNLAEKLDRAIADSSGLLLVHTKNPFRLEAHLYVDSQDPDLQQLLGKIEAALGTWNLGPVSMYTSFDPSWMNLNQYRF